MTRPDSVAMTPPDTTLSAILIPSLEAVYQVERDDAAWTKGFLDELRPAFGEHCLGIGAGIVEVSPDGTFTDRYTYRDVPSALTTAILDALRSAPAHYTLQLAQTPFLVGNEWPLWQQFHSRPNEWGVVDGLVLNGLDTDGVNFAVNVFLKRAATVDVSFRTAMARVTAHMTAAHRLRRRLQRQGLLDGAAAVLGPNGKIHHAEGAARTKPARDALERAARNMERARGPLRRSDPQEAVEIWRAMVRADWTLAEHVDSDGKRLLVARPNSPAARPIPELTPRETQVLAFANLGHHNKLIAYELGIASSTVRVLLTRAAAKLGATSRAELLRLANQRLATAESEPARDSAPEPKTSA